MKCSGGQGRCRSHRAATDMAERKAYYMIGGHYEEGVGHASSCEVEKDLRNIRWVRFWRGGGLDVLSVRMSKVPQLAIISC